MKVVENTVEDVKFTCFIWHVLSLLRTDRKNYDHYEDSCEYYLLPVLCSVIRINTGVGLSVKTLLATPPNSGPVNSDRIGFFFGAGASIEFGIPSMKKMTTTFPAKIRSKVREKKAFTAIYKTLAKVYGEDNVDLEAVMSVIAGLKEKERLRDNIGELGVFILERKGIINYANKFKYSADILESLEDKFKEYTRNKVVVHKPQKIDLARMVYFDFFEQVCAVSSCDSPNSPPSSPNKYTHNKWTFFTTNYDNVIEDFWVRGRAYSDLYLGFEQKNGKKVMNADRFLLNNTNDAHPSYAMQLVKLHGSVNWFKNKNGEIEEHPYHLSLDDVRSTSGSKDIQEDILIYPLSQKQLYFTPFIQLFRILDAELRKREFWIIVGYSFRDIIIRTMFERALAESDKRKILLIHPHATQRIKPLFQQRVRNQLTCLDSYFARRNYSSVNKEIADALLDL